MVTSSGQTESIEDVIDVDLESGCRFSGIEAPAVVEWSTEGKWRRSPAQPCCLTGSAYPTPALISHTRSKHLRRLCTRSEWSRQGDSRSQGVSPR
jgi:hypothetical protein